MIAVAICADWIAPHSPVQGSLRLGLLPPAWLEGGNPDHLLGTDKFGRDILSRFIYGARVSVSVSFMAIAITASVGTILGLLAGYFKGWLDIMIMRWVDLSMSFPPILIALILAVALGPSLTNIIIIVLIIYWSRFARQVRGEVLSIKETEYVILAKSAGVSPWKIMMRHFFPNVLPSLLVLSTFQLGDVIILEATLSFLGCGIPPPNPSWGVIIAEGRNYIEEAWWICVFPGIGIGLTCLSMNMIGDWIRDKLDPKLRQV